MKLKGKKLGDKKSKWLSKRHKYENGDDYETKGKKYEIKSIDYKVKSHNLLSLTGRNGLPLKQQCSVSQLWIQDKKKIENNRRHWNKMVCMSADVFRSSRSSNSWWTRRRISWWWGLFVQVKTKFFCLFPYFCPGYQWKKNLKLFLARWLQMLSKSLQLMVSNI